MESWTAKAIDRYKIVNLLGEGGMGAVLKARDITLQRDVAVKVMHPQYARQPNFRERFLQEARTAAKLDHPGIIKVHDFGQAQGHLYIVMEFIPGDNLRKMLENLKATSQWIALPEAIQFLRQVCLAIDYAHHRGVLHRDIKPDNIMLKPEPSHDLPYRPVLTDLGLAKLAEGGLLTQAGVSLGTPAYISPEQARGEKTDARSDVYSLGILLFELVTGQLPFPAKTITEAIRYHTKEPPPSPSAVCHEVPDGLERLILKALEKNPADRFSDAMALAEVLAQVLPAVTEVSFPSREFQGTASLLAQYQQSLADSRSPSLTNGFPPPPSNLLQDCIQILEPDRVSRWVEVTSRTLTIGRATDNDLVLDSPGISPHHARVDSDGTRFQVTDLDSANGTFLSNLQLLPGVPEVWAPGELLGVGGVWLRLVRAQASRLMETAIYRSDGTIVDPSLIHRSTGTGRIGVFAVAEHLSVSPGTTTTVPVIVLNQHNIVDHFTTSVEGIPSSWVQVTPSAPVRLLPGHQQEVNLNFQPSRTPASRAGRYPLTIRVASQEDPHEVVQVKQTLTVAPYSGFSSDLRPQRVRAGSPARVTVQNQGNIREIFTVTWTDRADEVAFQPPHTQLTIPEGQSAATEFRAKPRQRRWVGDEKTYSFSAQVYSADVEAQTHSGEVVSRALLPVWILTLLLFLCLILAAAAVFAYNVRNQQIANATVTAVASRTAGAVELVAAQTATAQADTDGDGLSDARERRLRTDPGNPDTDGDTLKDGEELDRYDTDPLKADTDGDGLHDGDERSHGSDPQIVDSDGDRIPDGKEVHELHTSPINPDTDGDGLYDSVDPHPSSLPTAIHMPAPTPNPTLPSTPVPPPEPGSDSTVSLVKEERIRFARGGSSVAFQTDLEQDVAKAYVLRILGQQHMFVSATGDTNLLALDADDNPLTPVAQDLASSPRRWEFVVPRSGDYTLMLQGIGDASITVVIPPLSDSTDLKRIRFASGATSTSLTTTLLYGETEGYVLRAMSGQRMHVVVDNSAVDVTVRDPSNQPLPSISASEDGRWQFHLSQTGDYAVFLEGVGQTTVSIEIPPP